ncbi:MAG TPA: hypothetical protein VIF32_05505 [Gemmatimonadaceae bacterium]|jgi:hypothetical protein
MSTRKVFGALILTGTLLTLAPSQMLGQKRQRDRITRQEILNSAKRDLDLFEVIRSERPHFLEGPRGARSIGGASGVARLAVFIDGRRESGVDMLKSIAPTTVEEIRYLDPTAAENEYGPTASGGALLIKLFRQR